MATLKSFIKELVLIVMLVVGLNLLLSASSFANSFKDNIKSLQYNNSILSQFYTQFLQLSGQPQEFNSTNADAQLTDAIQKVSPAVVAVLGEESHNSFFADSNFANTFFSRASAGTGFFVDSSGYILTNNHVINNQDFEYTVALADGSRMPATIVFRDPQKDLAIIKIDGSNFPTLTLGDSAALEVGQTVGGIGDAFGIATDTVSSGQISGLNKSIIATDDQGDESLSGLIRTTAQLYPGDSGGPLFDINGNVVGIDVATSSNRPNLSFSIPINAAKPEIENIIGHQI